jgi:hypothetical protein
MGATQNMYFGKQFAWLKHFTYHLVPVLAPNCKQHVLSPAKVELYFGVAACRLIKIKLQSCRSSYFSYYCADERNHCTSGFVFIS